ncbi:MAG: DUF4191 family protein [Demequinaceae bacterium]|nr:DUF4191 family protein [Demequinaceae bacterium]
MANATKPPKVKWWNAIFQAFGFIRKNDPVFLPAFIIMFVLISGSGITLGFLGGSVTSHIYANIAATLLLILGTLILLIRRVDTAQFNAVEGTLGGSLQAARTIRRGWKFEDNPIEVDPKGRAVVFLGVGKGGIVLIAEGGPYAQRPLQAARARLNRIVPGVPLNEFHAGLGQGQLRLKKLVKSIKGLKKILSKRERAAIESRIHALGAVKLPIPKGIDPMRARPDRKALRGR